MLPILSSVRGRIIAGFGLLVLILAAVVAGSAWQAREHRSVLAETEEHAASAADIEDARFNVVLVGLLLERYITLGDDPLVPAIRSSMAMVRDSLSEAVATEEMRADADELAALEEVRAGSAFLTETAEEVIAQRQRGDIQGARATWEAAVPRLGQFGMNLVEAADFERQEVLELHSRADGTADVTLWVLVISGAIGAAVGLAAAAFITRSILRPLSSLESAALAVADGDLEARTPATGPQELARLGASLNRMTESLLDASKRRELETERERHLAKIAEVNRALSEELQQRVRAEEELRVSEAKYRTLVEQTPAVIYIDEFDETISHKYRTLYVSPQVEAMLGYRPDELLADPELWSKIRHPDDRERVLAANDRHNATGQPFNLEYRMHARDGRIVWIHDEAVVVRDEAGQPLFSQGVLYDMSERKRAEEETKAALKEKEVLLREIHHRVKNNLQVICSLLNLQAGQARGKQAPELFKETQSRVSSLALVHEKLCRSRDLARVDFADYIGSLVVDLYRSYGVSSEAVTPKIDADGVSLDVDTAMPCGLIITELVSNSLKYAFPEGRKGEVLIDLHVDEDGKFTLIVADDGVGLRKGFDIRNAESLGLQLVYTLAEQLGGAIKIDSSGGTAFKITFPASRGTV